MALVVASGLSWGAEPNPSSAQPGALTVVVTDAQGTPTAGAEVRVLGLPWAVATDDKGEAHFPALRPGRYVVQVQAATGAKASGSVQVQPGTEASLTLTLELATFHEEVTVSGARPEKLVETTKPVSALADENLTLVAKPSLGETLSALPGVRSSYYAPGASRPLVRGFGGDRVRVLANGLDLGDASDTSPDHGVALDPVDQERIEVLRGPAALLYGSGALGGVIDARGPGVPERAPGAVATGSFLTRLASNPWTRQGRLSLEGQLGSLLWQAGGSKMQAENYRWPSGAVANSFNNRDGANLGVAVLRDWGLAGVAFDQHETSYGSPVEEDVHVDLWRRRLEMRVVLTPKSGFLESLRASLAHVDYHHTEFEGPDPGTRVRNRLTDARVELAHTNVLGFQGVVGVEGRFRDLSVTGEETYLPRTTTDHTAAFFWEHRKLAAWELELGGRFDHHRHHPAGSLPSRSFSFESFAASLTWNASDTWKPYLAASVQGKAPNPEELYSSGPHAATGLFEVGDPTLRRERTKNLELGLVFNGSTFHLKANLFAARASNFLYQVLTREVEDDLPVARFTQKDGRFAGGELSAHFDLYHRDERHLELTLGADAVRATLSGGQNLPRIPPARYTASFVATWPRFRAAVGVQKVLEATRLAPGETPTPGYTLWDASLTTRFLSGNTIHVVGLRGENLTDAKALNHASFFKEKTPLPGRSVAAFYQLWF
ncbi:MAG: TonB-dependent receptor [Thermoanaerobaculum sp.]